MRSTRSVPLAVSGEGAFRRIVRRNLSAISGLALLALSAAIAASLATWTVDDPSLSHATDRDPRNALGVPGAVVADLIMQFFGLAAIALLLPPVVWAWRLVFGREAKFGWRTCAVWVASTLLSALSLATLPVIGTWPLPTGFGGVTGDLLLRVPAFFLGAHADGICRRRPLRRLRRRRRVLRHPRVRLRHRRPASRSRRRDRRGTGGRGRVFAPGEGVSPRGGRRRGRRETMTSTTRRRTRKTTTAPVAAPSSMGRWPIPRSASSA